MLRYKGMAFSRTHQSDSAFINLNKAIEINKKLNDLKSESKNLISIGAMFYKMEENIKAIEYYEKAYNVSSQINYTPSMTQALNNIG
ncbi:MAG TPA: tetratricopeptide repeat protein, partial [Prolixibacteraceae bacterium]|nr:tetratricopeptide repeat protein [Prolixibacteraceae bacterium]